MNRDEFERAYADKYMAGDLSAISDNRDGEGYADHHIDLCWKVEISKTCDEFNLKPFIDELEW